MKVNFSGHTRGLVGTLTLVMVAALTACGGGGVTGTSLSGRVIDGYINGAVVCLDVDNSKTCSEGEPTAITTEGGRFVLNPPSDVDLSTIRVIANVPGTAVDEDTGNAVGTAFQLTAPANLEVVTPLTTLALAYMDTGETLQDAVGLVKSNLGISDPDFDVVGDYVANSHVPTHNVARLLAGVFKENQLQGSANLRNAVPKIQTHARDAHDTSNALDGAPLQALVDSAAYASRQQLFASVYTPIGENNAGAWIDSLQLYAQGETDTGGLYGRDVFPSTDVPWWNTWMGVAAADDSSGNGANFYWGSWDASLTSRTYMETWVRAGDVGGFDISEMGKLNIKIWGHPDSTGVPTFTPVLEAEADGSNCTPRAELSSPLVGAATANNALVNPSDAEFQLDFSMFTVTEGCGRVNSMSEFITEGLRFVRVRVYLANAVTPNVGINVGAISFEP